MKRTASFAAKILFIFQVFVFTGCNLFISWNDFGSVSGDAIVQIALHEDGRTSDQVGRDLTVFPFGLGLYVRPDEAWCSEFVCWCYKVAGDPFSGATSNGVTGASSGWILRSSTDIKNYFQTHKTFVDRSHPGWGDGSFVPKPGDYIRYNNASGGHSGIVDHLDVTGTILYTVEGNVSDRVQLRTINDWRTVPNSIDGFGVR